MSALLASLPEWFTVRDLLDLQSPSLPSSERGIRDLAARQWQSDPTRFRIEPGRGADGGAFSYHVSLFPSEVRAALLSRAADAVQQTRAAAAPDARDPAWAAFEARPAKEQEEARSRLAAIEAVDQLSVGMTRYAAVMMVARERGVSMSTLWSWIDLVKEVPIKDRLPALAPRRKGRTATAECHPAAWDYLVADYLRPEEPSFAACYHRLMDVVAREGWAPVPSAKTLQRRIEKDIPRAARTMARKGRDTALAIFPHQTRDRSVFAAMEAVNADGHTFDVFCRWPDGTIARPILVGVQDLYSGCRSGGGSIGRRAGRWCGSPSPTCCSGSAFRTTSTSTTAGPSRAST